MRCVRGARARWAKADPTVMLDAMYARGARTVGWSPSYGDAHAMRASRRAYGGPGPPYGVVFLLRLAFPYLAAPEQRETDKAPHFELLAVVGQVHLAAVGLAVLRVEDFAAVPVVAVFLQAP